jgi:ABC-type taurine transport system substrate-binding protein
MEYNDAEELWKGIHAGWYRLKYPPGSLQVDTEQAFAFLPPLGYELTRSGRQEDGTEFVEYSSPSLEVRVVQTDWASADVDFTQPGQTRTRVPLKAFTPYWDDPFAFPPVRFTQGRLAGLKRLAERTERYAGDAIRGDQSSFQRALDRTRRMDGEYVD